MKRVIFSFVVAIILGMFSINSCTSTGNTLPASAGTINKNLIGVWERQESMGYISTDRFVFFDNGTYLANNYTGRYSIHNDVLMTTSIGRDNEYGTLYVFSISGSTLTLLYYGSPEEQKATYKKVK